MFSASASTPARKNEKISRLHQSIHTGSPPPDLVERSDVDCWTCRRRHIKCDRIISPTGCNKCAKKPVQCLGYQKPLRWADGVAVRGKFKGKSQPVVDNEIANIVRNTMELQSSSSIKNAEHFGLHTFGTSRANQSSSEGTDIQLMNYHNATMCAERVKFEVPFGRGFITRAVATLTPDIMRRLPKEIVNCILGNAAVHMAARQPGNRALETLALESKYNIFRSFNGLLDSPQHQRADVIIANLILIFAMDLLEHGMDRWSVHFHGSLTVLAKFGGVENLTKYYPSLRLALQNGAYFDTFWIILSHVPTGKAKMASREAVKMLSTCQTEGDVYNPCPAPLMLAVWEIGSLASELIHTRSTNTLGNLDKRERILRNVLAYQTDTDVQQEQQLSGTDWQLKQLIRSVWKSAVTILALRYLYFGRPNLLPRPQAPSFANETNAWFRSEDLGLSYQSSEESKNYEFFGEMSGTDDLPEHLSVGLSLHETLSRSTSPFPPMNDPEHLSPGYYPGEPSSRSPSPLASPQLLGNVPQSNLWENRYELHNEALSTLSSAFLQLHANLDPKYFRFIFMPLLILALVSRKGSLERNLCFAFFARFQEHMATNYPPGGTAESPSPQGGEALDFEIAWDKLDAYSQRVEDEQSAKAMLDGNTLTQGAPEWNWWDMLKEVQINMIWPITAGIGVFERGSEFWAFSLISSIVNDECFSHWLDIPNTAHASTSSS